MLQNLNELANAIESSMSVIMDRRSFRDPGVSINHPQWGTQVFAAIAGVLDEYVDLSFTAVSVFISCE